MCTPSVLLGISALSTAVTVYGQYQQGRSQRRAFEYQAAINRQNATIADTYADDATARARVDADQHRQQIRQARGAQRAAIASAGFDVGSDSAVSLLSTTSALGELDAQRILSRGDREAYGFLTQGLNYRSQADALSYNARIASRQGLLNAGGSLLTGATNFYNTGRNLGVF